MNEWGFEPVVVSGRAKLRCTVCGTTGEPWEWPLARRCQHARTHAGVTRAAEAERKLDSSRQELQAVAQTRPHRDRRVLHAPRVCANEYCAVVFQPRRTTARYCSGACRMAVHRRRHGGAT
jgi:hypothetical protein